MLVGMQRFVDDLYDSPISLATVCYSPLLCEFAMSLGMGTASLYKREANPTEKSKFLLEEGWRVEYREWRNDHY